MHSMHCICMSLFVQNGLYMQSRLDHKLYIRLVSYYVECRKTNGETGRGVGASHTQFIKSMGTPGCLAWDFPVNCYRRR
jgi:hypothetical protein